MHHSLRLAWSTEQKDGIVTVFANRICCDAEGCGECGELPARGTKSRWSSDHDLAVLTRRVFQAQGWTTDGPQSSEGLPVDFCPAHSLSTDA